MTFNTRAMLMSSITLAAVACSKQPAQETPLVVAPPQLTQKAAPVTLTATGKINASGIAATYEARFEDGQLDRIVESRQSGSAEYAYKGARLLHYSGSALHDARAVELRMDVNGKVLSAMAGSDPLTQEQISEITSRAQLLRSHALTQAAVSSHQ
jgi:hypothetical protein